MKIFPYKESKVNEYFNQEKKFQWLSHPNIVTILETQPIKKGYSDKKPLSVSYILMEFAPFGDFAGLISKRRLPRNDQLVRTYFSQLAAGLQYMHQNGVAHLDLKLDNLLLGKDYLLKISDFDFSVELKKDFMVDHLGVVNYRAPELKFGRCKNFRAADIYSAGIILFLLKTGLLPYAEEGNSTGQALYKLLLEGKEDAFWKLQESRDGMPPLDDSFKKLFLSMVNPNPKERITIDEVVFSDWMRGSTYSSEELQAIMQQKLDGHIPPLTEKETLFC